MRFRLLLLSALCLTTALTASADDDREDYHVEAILFSGDTVSGYLRNDAKTVLKNIFSKSMLKAYLGQ